MRPLQTLGNTGVILEHLDAADDVNEAGLLNGFARIESLQFCELLVSISQKRRRPSQNSATLSSRCRGPRLKCRMG